MQSDLFGWEDQNANSEWVGMPEYLNVWEEDPEITATFKFRCQDDYDRFHQLVKDHVYGGSRVFGGTQRIEAKSTWYPPKEKPSVYEWVDGGEPYHPRFPVYIISKGRYHLNPTANYLTSMGVTFYMIVEEDEYEEYLAVCPESRLLVLPQGFKDEYDTFWPDERTGSGPARNYAWEHSMSNGHEWHWLLDDNIDGFQRFNNNMKIKVRSGTCFYVVEDFVLRYENVAIGGLNYSIFCPGHEARPPVRFNTRIYSCLLIRNDIPFSWRGLYNEDVDLCLRVLKEGWCTVMFNAFLAEKMSTTKMSGGNTEELYGEGTKKKSEMIVAMHPDVTTLGERFGRWHHYVDYGRFKANRLVKKEGVEIPESPNNYGLVLRTRHPSEHREEKYEDTHHELGTIPTL